LAIFKRGNDAAGHVHRGYNPRIVAAVEDDHAVKLAAFDNRPASALGGIHLIVVT
jgi:hypothetical protein